MRNALELINSWDPFREFEMVPLTRTAKFVPAVDAEETESHFIFTVDMPGVKKEDIQIELKDGDLRIFGERKFETESKTKQWSERGWGKFERVFTIGTTVDSEKVDAVYTDGVLKISVPKAEAAKPRRIAIH